MYILTTPNLNATGHRWIGMLASFKFTLEYQKGVDYGAADALSWVPIHQDRETVRSLLEGAIMGAANRAEAEASKELLCEHLCLENEACVQAAKLTPMHIVDWGKAHCLQEMASHSQGLPISKKGCTIKEILG